MDGFDRNAAAFSGTRDACSSYRRMGDTCSRAFNCSITLNRRRLLELYCDGPGLSLRLQSANETLNHRHPHHGPHARHPERFRICGV